MLNWSRTTNGVAWENKFGLNVHVTLLISLELVRVLLWIFLMWCLRWLNWIWHETLSNNYWNKDFLLNEMCTNPPCFSLISCYGIWMFSVVFSWKFHIWNTLHMLWVFFHCRRWTIQIIVSGLLSLVGVASSHVLCFNSSTCTLFWESITVWKSGFGVFQTFFFLIWGDVLLPPKWVVILTVAWTDALFQGYWLLLLLA